MPIVPDVYKRQPYGHGLAPVTLDILSAHRLLDSDGIIVTRHESRQEMPDAFEELKFARREKYGDTIISFYMLKR